jgi:hypothetical protein
MAGEFSRYGKFRAMNTALSIGGMSGSNLGDQVGTINAAISAGTTGTTSLTVTALSRSIPSGSVIICSSTTGTNVEAYTTSANAASAATSISVTSQTSNKARAVGDPVWVLQVPQIYLALITTTTAPLDNALGSEYTATGYARQPVTFTAPTAADPPVTQNSALMTWGPMTAGTGSVVGSMSAMDALSGGAAGNQCGWWTLSANKTPGTGDSVTLAAGALTSSWQNPG